MRLLFLSPVIPEPPTDGGRQRVHHLLETLTAAHDVTFVGLTRDDTPVNWQLATRFAASPVYVEARGASPGDSLSELTSASRLSWLEQPDVLRRLASTRLWHALQNLALDSFDAVHVETMALAPFAMAVKARAPRLVTVLDLPDVASHFNLRLFRRAAMLRPSALKDLLDLRRLTGMEQKLLPRFDAVIACSQVDAARLEPHVLSAKLHVVPNCTTTSVDQLPPSQGCRLVFVGTMSYPPNEEGVLYFCNEVMPLVRQAIPDASFWIVGKSPSLVVRDLAASHAGVHVTGAVESVRPYLADAAATVVPLLSGGGTRLKILEAMAAGRAVVSTSVGAEGLDLHNGEDVLLADSPESMADACVSLLQDAHRRHALERHGRRLVEQHYDWSVAQRGLLGIYGRLQGRVERLAGDSKAGASLSF